MAIVARAQIINAIRKKTGLPESTVRDAIGDTIDIITQAIINGDTVVIRGIGTIRKVERNARDPRVIGSTSGESKRVWGVKFNSAKKLRRAVR